MKRLSTVSGPPRARATQAKRLHLRARSLVASALFVLGAACGLAAAPASAATITVTNLGDSGAGTLREAIATAANAATNPGDDTITFGVTGVIRLASTLPTIASVGSSGNLTIQGPSGGITISGDADSSGGVGAAGDVQVLRAGSGANPTLDRLTITGGYATDNGGGIYTEQGGALTVSNCTFTNNTAAQNGGAIYSSNAPPQPTHTPN